MGNKKSLPQIPLQLENIETPPFTLKNQSSVDLDKFKRQNQQFYNYMHPNCYGNVNISNKQTSQLQQFLSQLATWDITNSLSLINNKSQKMLKCLQDIKFIKLKRLYLQQNKIESIQPITRIDLTYLQILKIGNNRITDFRSLRKANFINLFYISIGHGNKIRIQQLSELRCPKLETFSYISYVYQQPVSLIVYFIKLETKILKKIQYQHLLIKKEQGKVYESLRRKYASLPSI